jgi:hypothetical protein
MKTNRVPRRPRAAQPPLPGDHAQAAHILQHLLSGDVLGRGPKGHVYLLLEVEGWLFDRLCRWGAEDEDIEEDDAAEEEDPAEASTGIDEALGGWLMVRR